MTNTVSKCTKDREGDAEMAKYKDSDRQAGSGREEPRRALTATGRKKGQGQGKGRAAGANNWKLPSSRARY